METNNILQVNSSGRYDDSITRQVSDLVVGYLKQKLSLDSVNRDVATGLPFVNEAWINANFTAPNERTEIQNTVLGLSNTLVAELKNATHIVIAAPLYNFGIPATLKTWIDLIARVQLTFQYSEKGPVGLLENKKAYVIMASGGTPLGSEQDSATPYLRQVLAFIGISDVIFIDSSQVNYASNEGTNATAQIAALIDKRT